MKTTLLRSLALAVLLISGTLVPAVLAQDGGTPPDQIVVERPGFFPEGIEYDDAGGRFLLGSLMEGTIYQVQDDGTSTPFIEDEDLSASVGIHIDRERNRLLVCNTDHGAFQGEAGPISLAAYDLETGERQFLADLSAVGPQGGHFCNDVTVDADGNAYATDSFAPVIYKVDTEGNASVFLQDDRFASEGFGLNGIDYHPDGYLIVAMSSDNALYKVPLDDPSAAAPVTMDEAVQGADGIILAEDGTLYAVGAPSTVYHVSSDDDWATAQIVERVQTEQSGTTATLRDGEVYVVFAHLDALGAETPPQAYEIVHVPFEGTSMDAGASG